MGTDTLSKPTSASSISAIINETIERRKRSHLEAKLSSPPPVCQSVEDVQLTRGRARMSLSVLRSDPATSKIVPPRKMMKGRRQRRRMHKKLERKRSPTNKPHAETPKSLSGHRPPSRMPNAFRVPLINILDWKNIHHCC